MRQVKPPEDPLTPVQIYVVVVSLATVALWCCNNLMARVTGEMGVLAILPLGEGLRRARVRVWGGEACAWT